MSLAMMETGMNELHENEFCGLFLSSTVVKSLV
jgi:hypothetical protein